MTKDKWHDIKKEIERILEYTKLEIPSTIINSDLSRNIRLTERRDALEWVLSLEKK